MRFRTSMPVAVCVFAAGLGVAGCSSSSSGGAAGAPAATGNVRNCLASGLSFALAGNRQTAQGQRTQVVDMTNKGSSACAMEGSPDVDLIGDTSSQPSYDWPLARSLTKGGAKVTLQPGATAHFDLVYLPDDPASGGDSKSGIKVLKMVIAAPSDDNQRDNDVEGSLTWPQDVLLQDAATHPGTYTMPVASGS